MLSANLYPFYRSQPYVLRTNSPAPYEAYALPVNKQNASNAERRIISSHPLSS